MLQESICRQFDFFSVRRVVFGAGQIRRLPELARQFGARPLLIYNGGKIGSGGVIDRVQSLLESSNLRPMCLRQRGEPRVENVDSAVMLAQDSRCDLVIAVGGGSAIDTAKAVAGLLTNGGSALDYMEVVGGGMKILLPACPWIAVPTTAGSGAEATRNAVIACPEARFKASIRSEHLLPRVALLDPELTLNNPPLVTACSGMDALCQLIESFTSPGAQPLTDSLALKGIELVACSLRRACQNGQDLEARQNMSLAALLSGITLTNAGLGAVHGIAAPFGANFPAPHGAVCAALLGPVLDANVRALRARCPAHPSLARYAAIGRILSGQPGLADPQAQDAAIRFAHDLARELSIPPLAQFGAHEEDLPRLVALARKSSSMRYNPVQLSDNELTCAIRQALKGPSQPGAALAPDRDLTQPCASRLRPSPGPESE